MAGSLTCECFFCQLGKKHPPTHTEFYPITHLLLKAESLDPADSVSLEACELCGHVREVRKMTIEVLQAEYEQLRKARAHAITSYDNAPDGSADKMRARLDLDRLGRMIVDVERRINDALDS